MHKPVKAYTGIVLQRRSPGYQDAYFYKEGTCYKIKEEVKQMVSFSQLNLLSDSYQSINTELHSLDVVFCRNVLMYFSPEAIKSVTTKLYDCLSDGGYLITGQTELSDVYL